MSNLNKDYFIKGLSKGITRDEYIETLDKAIAEYETKNKSLEKLKEAILDYVGRDNACWEKISVDNIITSFMTAIEFITPKEKCNCECKCSGKEVIKDKDGVHEKDLTPEEVNHKLSEWLDKLLGEDSLF